MRDKLIFVLSALLLAAAQPAFAQMSDDQIISYIAQGVASGKTERQIGTELMAKGVTTSQLQRLLKQYKSGTPGDFSVPGQAAIKLDGRRPERGAASVMDEDASKVPGKPLKETGVKKKKKTSRKTVSDTPGGEVLLGPDGKPVEGDDAEEAEGDEDEDSPLYDEDGEKIIYGHDIFSAATLSFEPNINAATPEDYVLGPGDELIIDVWGVNEATISQKVTPEGRIIVSQVGPIQLGGLTVKQATGKIRTALSKTYSSLRSGGSQLSVTLGEVRSIQVNVLGEVNTPGTFRLSAFSTVFTALYRAGGITDVGSLRNVRVVRGGETFAEVDIYSYIFDGRLDANVALKEGDVIIVPAYSSLVSIVGGIKRPMFYEMKEGEPLSRLIEYAGGFSGSAWKDDVSVERNDGRTNHIHTVKSADFASFAMMDSDAVSVQSSKVDVFTNRVEIKGAVYRPGKFEIGRDIATVRQLVEHAGGLLEDAFTGRAQIIRERADRSLEVVSVPLKGIMEGTVGDMLLQRNDILTISNINEVEIKGDFTITGYVANPGKYQFAEHTTVEDLILIAGGLSEGASSARVDVSRRIIDPYSTSASDTLAMVYSMAIKDGLVDEGEGGFELKPYDVVSVRRSPTYIEQRNVTITGEVTFPGQYTLLTNNERVSDLVKRAGGASPNGNVRGAMLKRKINQYERNVRTAMARIATQNVAGKDSVDLRKLKVSEIYTVGLELDKALAHPGSDYDIVLRDGDELIIPELASTVRIQGEVLYPNTVHYISGKPIRYYVRQAGGYGTHARRAKTYVVYMNGTVAVGRSARLEPGCEVVVPSRSDKDKLTTGEWLGIGTSAASITTMIATIVSLFR